MGTNPYLCLLDQYHAMVHQDDWWDGRREVLVALMDRTWAKLTEVQRNESLEYARKLYGARISQSNKGMPR